MAPAPDIVRAMTHPTDDVIHDLALLAHQGRRESAAANAAIRRPQVASNELADQRQQLVDAYEGKRDKILDRVGEVRDIVTDPKGYLRDKVNEQVEGLTDDLKNARSIEDVKKAFGERVEKAGAVYDVVTDPASALRRAEEAARDKWDGIIGYNKGAGYVGAVRY